MANAIILTGWKEFQAKAKNLPKLTYQKLDRVCGAAIDDWVRLAKSSAPIHNGDLVKRIEPKKAAVMNWEAVSRAAHSPYMEWGTKSRAQVPSEMANYASQFRRGIKGGNPRKMIYEWCRKQGIEQRAWWPIFRSIMVHGVRAQPFFFIHRDRIFQQVVIDANKILTTPN